MLQNTQSLDINFLNKITSDEYIKYFKNNRDFNSFRNLMIKLSESIDLINNNKDIVTELKSNMSNIMIWINNYSAALENRHIVNYLKNISNLLSLIENTTIVEEEQEKIEIIIDEVNNSVTEQINDSATEQVNDPVTESVNESVIEEVNVSVTELVNDLVTESVNETVIEEVNDSVPEQINDSAIEQVNDPIAQQVNELVIEEVNDESSNIILNGPFNNETIQQSNLNELSDNSNYNKNKKNKKKNRNN